MSTQTVPERSTTPEPHRQDGYPKNATTTHLLPGHLSSSSPVATRLNLPILAALLLTCAPTICLYAVEQRRRSHQQPTDLSILVWTYILAGTVGITVAMLAQAVLAYLLALLCFHGLPDDAMSYLAETAKTEHDITDDAHRQRRRAMARRRGYWAFMLLFSFVAAGLVEEGIKYVTVTAMLALLARRSSTSTPRDSIAVAVSAALGFATVENCAFISAATRRSNKGRGAAPKDAMFALLTAMERVVLGIPGHAMTATLIGINMKLMRDDHDHFHRGHTSTTSSSSSSTMNSAWLVLRDPVLFHGCFDFMLFAVSALEGNVGWVHPRRPRTVGVVLALAVGLQATLASVLRARLCRVGLCAAESSSIGW
ncbi:hypothetical protein AYL99_05899 [Fonsecaea erecta]|uniref:Uncharacterized protein n=1 Tax=Fonsecaea erecta TaxID=1367422 RepID=A0A178ZM93_9EURO|nr:hypothetical protein AYL99_05899 [Fonsecaea erecta]OAP60897.1 hypothetical protein AYL99_05899 [Fonsecaea erecta]